MSQKNLNSRFTVHILSVLTIKARSHCLIITCVFCVVRNEYPIKSYNLELHQHHLWCELTFYHRCSSIVVRFQFPWLAPLHVLLVLRNKLFFSFRFILCTIWRWTRGMNYWAIRTINKSIFVTPFITVYSPVP